MEGPSIHRLSHHRYGDRSAMFHFQYIAADVQKVRNYLREEEMAEVQTKHVTSMKPCRTEMSLRPRLLNATREPADRKRLLGYSRSNGSANTTSDRRDNPASANGLWTDTAQAKQLKELEV
jgi:hypothetical protein